MQFNLNWWKVHWTIPLIYPFFSSWRSPDVVPQQVIVLPMLEPLWQLQPCIWWRRMSSVNTFSAALKERMTSMASSLQDVFDGGEESDPHNPSALWWKYTQIDNTAVKGQTAPCVRRHKQPIVILQWQKMRSKCVFCFLPLKLMFCHNFSDSSSSNSSPDVKRKEYGKMDLPQ